MRCLNKINFIIIFLCLSLNLLACSSDDYPLKYGESSLDDNFNMDEKQSQSQLDLFAKNLCATDTDILDSSAISSASVKSAGVFDINNCQTLYAYNVNEQVNPASLTKIMTALVVLDNCNLDDIVTVGDVTINESGVQLFGLNEGDKISVRDLLYVDLVYSGNDASLALSNYLAGSDEAFAEMMNEKALSLGATNTNFVNSHGLSHENHYTTAYDLYLIFNAVLKYDEFKTIINTATYDVTYTNSSDEIVTKTITTTNKYLTGAYDGPSTTVIVGGKTGSTQAAGKCLILYSNNSAGQAFISIIMGAGDESALYTTMTSLCNDTIK